MLPAICVTDGPPPWPATPSCSSAAIMPPIARVVPCAASGAGRRPNHDRPPLAVAVPVTRRDTITGCVRRCANNHEGPVAIIVVDDGSTDDTVARPRRQATVITTPRWRPPRRRYARVGANIICFTVPTVSHTLTISTRWSIRRCRRQGTYARAALVGGSFRPAGGEYAAACPRPSTIDTTCATAATFYWVTAA
jgi:hypothetical protein